MQLENLKVQPFNTTLMGVVRGVSDYLGLEYSDAMLYGATGHAFLINIHEALCPSGPYCWNPQTFHALLRNLGIEMADHGFFSQKSSPEQRAEIEKTLRDLLDRGVPCSLLNMENQLITGYDDTGFAATQPWAPHADFPPAHLTFGTWEELGEEIHMNFFSFQKCEPSSATAAIAAGLQCGADMFATPEHYTSEPYGAGGKAYEKWIGAVEGGHGKAHGNWWNATVWAECRKRAAEYLGEIAESAPQTAALASELAAAYKVIAANLERASDKEMAADEKITLLREIATAEAAAAGGLADMAAKIRS